MSKQQVRRLIKRSMLKFQNNFLWSNGGCLHCLNRMERGRSPVSNEGLINCGGCGTFQLSADMFSEVETRRKSPEKGPRSMPCALSPPGERPDISAALFCPPPLPHSSIRSSPTGAGITTPPCLHSIALNMLLFCRDSPLDRTRLAGLLSLTKYS